MNNECRVYKIKRLSDGLFSDTNGRWTKTGKLWKQISHADAHVKCHPSKFKGDCYILITYVLEEIERIGLVMLQKEI